ncbi:flagellar basal body L-ring protein FlgH [Parvularcula oceani]|uniref:flagellar basal body L-ring protein FlgH n=1 Tax=Parvularcula oceani TaxID=1247963 RepID=UPI000567F7E6|nr:flagellar basal body L-ring protein FlgH [Parvularcula oceani]
MKARYLVLALLGACASTKEGPVQDEARGYPVATPASHAGSASLWNQEPQSLFGNRRARDIGDILTVIVSVDDEAEMENSLEAERSNEENFGTSALFGLPQLAGSVLPDGASLDPGADLTRSRAQNGSGRITRRESVTLELAAVVTDKLANGHLVIEGTQRIRVNHETRALKIMGIVRPQDIDRNNTITHEKIAAADIVYSGYGQVARSTSPRFGSRLLDILVPF